MTGCTLLLGSNLELKDDRGIFVADSCNANVSVAVGLLVSVLAVAAIAFFASTMVFGGQNCHIGFVGALSSGSLSILLAASAVFLLSALAFIVCKVKEKHKAAFIISGVMMLLASVAIAASAIVGVKGIGIFGAVSKNALLSLMFVSSSVVLIAVTRVISKFSNTQDVKRIRSILQSIRAELNLAARVLLDSRRRVAANLMGKLLEIETTSKLITAIESCGVDLDRAKLLIKQSINDVKDLQQLIEKVVDYTTEKEVAILNKIETALDEVEGIICDIEDSELYNEVVALLCILVHQKSVLLDNKTIAVN